MNIAPLKKSILKEGGVFLVFILSLVGASVFLDSLVATNIAQKNAALSSATSTATEERNLREKLRLVSEGQTDYSAFKEYAEKPGMFIDSQAAFDLLNDYKKRLMLNKLSLEMQPIVEVKDDPKLIKKEFVATRTSIKLKVESASDQDMYRLVAALQEELPGFTKVASFSISKIRDLSKESVEAIRRIGTYSLVSMELNFDWYGMRATDKDSSFNQYTPKPKEEQTP